MEEYFWFSECADNLNYGVDNREQCDMFTKLMNNNAQLTLSDPGYFRQLTIRGGGGALKAPPLRSRKLLCQSSPYHTSEFYQVF